MSDICMSVVETANMWATPSSAVDYSASRRCTLNGRHRKGISTTFSAAVGMAVVSSTLLQVPAVYPLSYSRHPRGSEYFIAQHFMIAHHVKAGGGSGTGVSVRVRGRIKVRVRARDI